MYTSSLLTAACNDSLDTAEQPLMAACEGKESLCTLKITYEALEERNKLLRSEPSDPPVDAVEDSSNDHPKINSTGGTRGLLYLPPTMDITPKEKRTRRNRRRSRRDQTRLTTPQDTLQPSDHITRATQEVPKRSKSSRGSEQRERILHKARHNHNVEPAKTGVNTGVNTEQGDSAHGWNQYENRRIERTLSRWSGDPAKLDPVIRIW